MHCGPRWLRNLIAAGELPPGVVDTRDVRRVEPDELRRYRRCHFFAGIGGWALALELAGWPEDVACWTGSCPCQPFSAAGKSAGFADERHLWPFWFHLIDQCRPPVVFGEQVAAAVKHGWLDLVHADLEGIGYACGDSDLPAAGVGAPHIRQRLWFVGHDADGRKAAAGTPSVGQCHTSTARGGSLADSNDARLEGRDAGALGHERAAAERGGGAGSLADSRGGRREAVEQQRPLGRTPRCEGSAGNQPAVPFASGCGAGALADDDDDRREEQRGGGLLDGQRPAQRHDADRCGAAGCGVADAELATGQGGQAKRMETGRSNLIDAVLLASGPTPTGSPAETARPGQLNPAHSRWLMGLPPAWDACAPTATRSSRRPLRSS
jgi:hypothetical protein